MCLKSKTGFGQTWSNDKLNYLKWKHLNTKLLEIIKIQTFYIDHFSIWESLSIQYSLNLESALKLYETICENCRSSTTPSQHSVKCKNGPYIKCRSWWVDQYWYSWLFHSRPSRVLKTGAWLWILSKFKIECFKPCQMSHLMTSNETILNTKLLEIIKIYIWYIVHFSIWINFSQL